MSTLHLLDKELHPIVEAMPAIRFGDVPIEKVRAMLSDREVLGDAQAAGVKRSEVNIAQTDGPDVRALLYVPESSPHSGAGYLHIHGGGYVLGAPEMADIVNLGLCARLGLVILSVDYRLAPEHPMPAPLDDCYAGLRYLHEQAETLGISRERIGVGGESAGGGLAAALAIHARDQGQYAICHQHLTYPMLDNRTGTAESPGDPLTGEFVWTRESNQYGWSSLLGDGPAEAPQVPARVSHFEGLPPTWMFTVGLDLFRDENIAYAQGLLAAGVPTELIVLPGACHGFQAIPKTRLGARYARLHRAGLAAGLGIQLEPGN